MEWIYILAGIATIIGTILAIYRSVVRRHKVRLFVCDQSGLPRPDIAIVGPFDTVYPDEHGTVWVAGKWVGETIKIHDKETWRLLISVELTRVGDDSTIPIVLPAKFGGDCLS